MKTEEILCEYGCGSIGIYKFTNGKYCCSSHYSKCPNHREYKRKIRLGENNPMHKKRIREHERTREGNREMA